MTPTLALWWRELRSSLAVVVMMGVGVFAIDNLLAARGRVEGATTAFDNFCSTANLVVIVVAAALAARVFGGENKNDTWRLLGALPVPPRRVLAVKLAFVVVVVGGVSVARVALHLALASGTESAALVLRMLVRVIVFSAFTATAASALASLGRRLWLPLVIATLSEPALAKAFDVDPLESGPLALVRASIAGDDVAWPVFDLTVTIAATAAIAALFVWQGGRELARLRALAHPWSSRAVLLWAVLAGALPQLQADDDGDVSGDDGVPAGSVVNIGEVVVVGAAAAHVDAATLEPQRRGIERVLALTQPRGRVLLVPRPDKDGVTFSRGATTIVVDAGVDADVWWSSSSIAALAVGAHARSVVSAGVVSAVVHEVARGAPRVGSSRIAIPRRLRRDDLDHLDRLRDEVGVYAADAMAGVFVEDVFAGASVAPLARDVVARHVAHERGDDDDLTILRRVGVTDDAIAAAFARVDRVDTDAVEERAALDVSVEEVVVSPLTRGLVVRCSGCALTDTSIVVSVEHPLDRPSPLSSRVFEVDGDDLAALNQSGLRLNETWVRGQVVRVRVYGLVDDDGGHLRAANPLSRRVLR